MKKILFTVFLLQMAWTDISAIIKTPAQQLIERMSNIRQKGYMYGHQDDPFYGITWDWDRDRSDTKDLVGDYPGVMGFDIGGIEMDDAKNLDSVPFNRMREEIIAHHKRGGIITISWHPRNPLLGTTAWIEKDIQAYDEACSALKTLGNSELTKQLVDPRTTVKSILPGGAKHEKYLLWLHRVAEFMQSLKDEKGNPVPFIFRPYHENNGNWFWWGQKLCSDEEFHQLWDMTQDFLNQRMPDNVVWSYSPNLQGTWTETEWMKRYPGDDRVDLIGEDCYQWGTERDFVQGTMADLKLITQIAADHGKLIAVTECGYINSPDATWWTRVFQPIIEQFPVCYFLPWRNYKKEHFGASKDAKTADDFRQWSTQKNFLFVKDIQKIK